MKNIVVILLCILGATAVKAQQDHQYTQFMYNKLLVNPAYAGARGVPSLTAIYRNQWMGFEGAPQSALVSLSSPFLSPRVGVGAVLSHQSAGLQRDFFGSLAYSYDLIAKDEISLRVGVQGSIRSLSMNFAQAKTRDDNPAGDPSLNDQRVNDIYGNVGAGIYANILQRAYVGFAIPRIYTNTIGLNSNPAFITAKEFRHYYGMAGVIVPLTKDVKLLPSVLVKYVYGAPFDADVNFNLDIKNKVSFGLSGRLGGDNLLESIDLLAYWQATELFGVGLAYDFTLSRVRDYSAGSIEVLIQTDLKADKKRGKKGRKNLDNPRFFL
jgi:type IX secretion system PorP/SprF family membrane protein